MMKIRLDNKEIRKIVICIVITIIMITFGGCIVYPRAKDSRADFRARCEKATRITDKESLESWLEYGNGDAFIYGELEAVPPVVRDEISGVYSALKIVKEEYRSHSHWTGKYMQITHSWDAVDQNLFVSKELRFCGHVFDRSKIELPDYEKIDAIKVDSKLRYVYYGKPAKLTGTIFTSVNNGKIENAKLYCKDINSTFDQITADYSKVYLCIYIVVVLAIMLIIYISWRD